MTEDEQWQALVDAVGRQLPSLVENFLTRILPDPAYADSGLTLEDLRGSSLSSFAAMLSALGGHAPDIDALSVFASELGARRARQGVPLDSLVRAIRLDFSVLWDALSAPGLGADPSLLVRKAEVVWAIVDRFAACVQEKYLAKLGEIEGADADLQQQYLTQLLAPAEPSAADLSRIAGALRIDAKEALLVAAIDRNDSLIIKRRLRARPPRDLPVFTYDQGHHTLVIRPRTASSDERLSFQEAVLFDDVAVALAPHAKGIAGVRTAVSAAREIMRDLPMGSKGVFTLRDRWLSITAHRLSQVGCHPGRLIYAALDRCSDSERERLLEAAHTFLELGSLVATADRLACHRNTVVNRLAAFEGYTGLDLQKPRDSALALLAIGG
ncbi:helix-turn-helix domain-containing protein [Arthrobacter sp. NPDC056691]|uniref:helix-turn-helix domain-containing protein n=1 Tax=Arthrobacter sp. NPDC056691 TaxID=3345913 RepID=UPI00366A637D